MHWIQGMTKRSEEELPPEEIAARTDRTLRGLIRMKPEAHKDFMKRRAAKKGAIKRRRPSSS